VKAVKAAVLIKVDQSGRFTKRKSRETAVIKVDQEGIKAASRRKKAVAAVHQRQQSLEAKGGIDKVSRRGAAACSRSEGDGAKVPSARRKPVSVTGGRMHPSINKTTSTSTAIRDNFRFNPRCSLKPVIGVAGDQDNQGKSEGSHMLSVGRQQAGLRRRRSAETMI
jgi:hypothetical protein